MLGFSVRGGVIVRVRVAVCANDKVRVRVNVSVRVTVRARVGVRVGVRVALRLRSNQTPPSTTQGWHAPQRQGKG